MCSAAPLPDAPEGPATWAARQPGGAAIPAPPADVADMDAFYRSRVRPRYEQGAFAYGNAHSHHSPLWWAGQASEEVADNLFYIRQVLRHLAPRDGRPRVYVAGPYRADTPEQVNAHILQARDAAAALYRLGYSPFTPHSMTARFERDYPDLPDELYLETLLDWLPFCHAILLLPGWESSTGTLAEHKRATELDLHVFWSLEETPSAEEFLRTWAPA